MNKAQRKEYSSRAILQYKRLEAMYTVRIYKALMAQVSDVVAVLQERGVAAAMSALNRVVMNEGIGPVVRTMYIEMGLFFARKATREIRASIKKAANFGFDEEWIAAIINYFKMHLLNKAVIPITETTKQQILDILSQGEAEGLSIEEMVRRLESPDLMRWRAQMIARTEGLKAANYGRKLADQSSDFETEKEWIAANDHRTRHSHRLVDGEVIPSDARFQVQRPKGGVDMMDGPGDPDASPENVINCRCAIATVAARDERGNLIPKKSKISIIMPGRLVRPAQTILI